MTISLEPYKRELATTRAAMEAAMQGGVDTAFSIAVHRRAAGIMAEDLDRRPQSLEVYEHRREGGLTGPSLWRAMAHKRAAAPYNRKAWEPEAWTAKNREYQQIAQRLKEQHQVAAHLLVDRKRRLAYLVQENDQVKNALDDLVAALAGWCAVHGADDDFLTTSAADGLHRMLSERQDLLGALRLAQHLPKDVEVSVIPPEERPAALEVVEVAVSCIPVVGTAVAVLEATSGYDLFGYELDPVDRCVIGAGVLLPFAGRFVKGGRALYTAARMERLYGPGARRWSLALAAGERISEQAPVRAVLARADRMVRAGTKLDAKLAQEVVRSLFRMRLKSASPRGTPIAKYLSDAMKKLIGAKSLLSELDELALLRVVAKGPNTNLMKGQLLEELLEARISKWLRDPAGAAALGINVPPPHTLEFIPGHLIRDSAGRQITDGVLAHRLNGELVIAAIFEAKAGRYAARELRVASGGISSLSAAERAELRAAARDCFYARANRARLKNQPYPAKAEDIEAAIDKIEREFVQTEQGGQVRRDIERLDVDVDNNPTVIQVGEDFLPVHVSPKHTKVFGVLPKDVHPGNMAAELQGQGYNFEVLGMNVTQKELVDLSNSLKLYIPPEHLLGPPPMVPH